eukprot:2056856-Pleurochrysis_carterae.AAC.1
MGFGDSSMADANGVISYLTDDLQQTRGQWQEFMGQCTAGNHSNSRGRHALRLLEVDELRILPSRCHICCCISSQALLKLPKEL